jgi:hypothetical protein
MADSEYPQISNKNRCRTGSSTLRDFQMGTAAQSCLLATCSKNNKLGALKCFYSAMKAQDTSEIIVNVRRRFKNRAIIQKFLVKSSRSIPVVQATRFSPDRIISCGCPTKGFYSQSLTLTIRSTSPVRTSRRVAFVTVRDGSEDTIRIGGGL